MNALQILSETTGVVTISEGIATLEDGTTLDLTDAAQKQDEVLLALRDTVTAFETGDIYNTKNPYCRPYVLRALHAIKAFVGFKGDVLHANTLNKEP